MIRVTYTHIAAQGETVTHSYLCVTAEQAEHVCKMVENRVDNGYRLVDVTNEPDCAVEPDRDGII